MPVAEITERQVIRIMPGKNILMLAADSVEDYDVTVPFRMLPMVGHNVAAVCPDIRPGENVRTAVRDLEGTRTHSKEPGHHIRINADFTSVRVKDHAAPVVPGNRSPEYLRLDERVPEVVRHFANTAKPSASIRHGPQLLAAVVVLTGKQCSAYPSVRPAVERAGARRVAASGTFTNARVDGNPVSVPAWPAHPEWIRNFLEVPGTASRCSGIGCFEAEGQNE
jgi:protease I